ncbi:MAG: ASPIC/UnbV domain-containing protein [Verrucomicrobiota bacterium]
MNQGGIDFTNIAFLMGVADQFDGRAALSEDIDGDGRMDLLIVEDRWKDGQTLHIYRNTLETNHQWIGVRLREEPGKPSPVGAKIRVIGKDRSQVATLAAGETIHGQHSLQRHFGLGNTARVEAIEVIWVGGKTARIEKPAVGKYHSVLHP